MAAWFHGRENNLMPELLEFLLQLLFEVACELVGDWFTWRVNLSLILVAVVCGVAHWLFS